MELSRWVRGWDLRRACDVCPGWCGVVGAVWGCGTPRDFDVLTSGELPQVWGGVGVMRWGECAVVRWG